MRSTKIICTVVFFLCVVAILFVFSYCVTIATPMSNNAVVDFKSVFDNYAKCLEARKRIKMAIERLNVERTEKLKKENNETKRNQVVAEYDEEIKKYVVETLTPIVDEVKMVADQVAKSQKLGKVYDVQENVKGTDITQNVLEALNGKASVAVNLDAAKSAQEAQDRVNVTQTKRPVHGKGARLTTHTPLLADMQKSSIEVQFGADYDEPDISRMVRKARNNGLQSAYIYNTVGKNGKLFCRARVPVANMSEAKSVSQKLTQIGFSNYIVK